MNVAPGSVYLLNQNNLTIIKPKQFDILLIQR